VAEIDKLEETASQWFGRKNLIDLAPATIDFVACSYFGPIADSEVSNRFCRIGSNSRWNS
jgi:hypothetical protein